MLAPGSPHTVFLQDMKRRSKVNIIMDLALFWSLADVGPEQRVQSTLHVDALRVQVTFNRFEPLSAIRTNAAMLDEVLENRQLARQ